MENELRQMMKRREELEAQENRKNKKDFITYVCNVLSKPEVISDKGLPSASTKNKILNQLNPSTDSKMSKKQFNREPTVDEYGKHISGGIKDVITGKEAEKASSKMRKL